MRNIHRYIAHTKRGFDRWTLASFTPVDAWQTLGRNGQMRLAIIRAGTKEGT